MAKIIEANKKHAQLVIDEIMNSELGEVYFSHKNIEGMIEKSITSKEILLLMEKDNFIGMIWYSKEGTFNKYPYLHMILVNKKFRNKGVASKLMNYYEKNLTSAYKKVYLMVGDYNPSKALYERLGYTEVGYLEDFYVDGVHEYLMMKDKSKTSKESYKKSVVTSQKLDGLRSEKIGEYVKRSMITLNLSEEDIDELSSKEGSKHLFGLDIPVLRKVDSNLSEHDNRLVDGIPKYYGSPLVTFEEETYLIASTWSPNHDKGYRTWLAGKDFEDIRETAKNVWQEILTNIGPGKKELQTLNRFENWFTVQGSGETLIVDNANKPKSVRLDEPKKLYLKKFIEIYPLYVRREHGEDVHQEATKLTIDQVYFFSILKNLSAPILVDQAVNETEENQAVNETEVDQVNE